MTQAERIWLNNASSIGGSFIKTFAMACFTADQTNYNLLKPVLAQLMVKYPTYSKE